MNMIVTPLSATPLLPTPTTSELIVAIIVHILVAGLLLGIPAPINKRRASNAKVHRQRFNQPFTAGRI
jgi:hypothetical protein